MTDEPRRQTRSVIEMAARMLAIGRVIQRAHPPYQSQRKKPEPPKPDKRAKIKAARKQRNRT